MNQVKISGGQAVCLLFLSRIFALLSYSPVFGENATGLALLWGALLGACLQLLLVLPLLLFASRSPNRSPISLCAAKSPLLGRLMGVLYGTAILVQLVGSLMTFTIFMVSSVYPDASVWVLLVWMCVCIFICAGYGIEALGRASTISVFFLLAGMLAVTLILLPECSLAFVDPIGEHPMTDILRYALDFISKTPELFLLPLLFPNISVKPGRVFSGFLLLLLPVTELCFFLVIAVLGQRGLENMFPFFSLTAAASLPFLQRADSLHMLFWVMLTMFRCSLLLRLGGAAFLPSSQGRKPLMAGLLSFSFLLAGLLHGKPTLIRTIHLSSFPVILLLAGLLPLLLLPLARKEASHGKADPPAASAAQRS